MMDGTRVERKATDFVGQNETLRPLRDQIIVKVLPLKLSDTIHADWSGGAVRGQIIAAGPGCYVNVHDRGTKDGKEYRTVRPGKHFRKTEVRVGQIVHLGGMENGAYIWPEIYIGHDRHVICRELDICGIET